MGSNGEKIESFLIDTGLPFEKLAEGFWVLVNEADLGENLVVYLAEPVLTLRLKVFDLPPTPSPRLLRRLLELNASSMVHGAFGIEKSAVVLVGALEIENLDMNEFQALVDSFSLALAAHHDELSTLLAN